MQKNEIKTLTLSPEKQIHTKIMNKKYHIAINPRVILIAPNAELRGG
jgi:hypothetical protein